MTVPFIAAVEALDVAVDVRARVVVTERTMPQISSPPLVWSAFSVHPIATSNNRQNLDTVGAR